MQIYNAEVHVEVLGLVATVTIRHTYRNVTGQFFRFLYDVTVPSRGQLVQVEARAVGQWHLRSCVAPKEARVAAGEEEARPKHRPGIWPHAGDSGCYVVLDAPPGDAPLVVTYTYAQQLEVGSANNLRAVTIPCHAVCPGAIEGDAGVLPPDAVLTLCVWDADCVPHLRTHALKEVRSSEGQKYTAPLAGTARHLVLQFTGPADAPAIAVLQRYAPPRLPAALSDPLSVPSPKLKALDDWPMASAVTICPVLPHRPVDSSVVFLLDCSTDAALELFCTAAAQTLQWLPVTCTFNIIAMQATPKSLFLVPHPASAENIARAQQFLKALQPVPSTNYYDALAFALEGPFTPPPPALCRPHEAPDLPPSAPTAALTELVLFVSSPVPDLEACRDLLIARSAGARCFAVAVGPVADTQAAKELCRAAHGRYQAPEGPDWGLPHLTTRLREWMDLVAQPSCTDVTVTWEAPFHQILVPHVRPVLFHRQPCTLYALHDIAPSELAAVRWDALVCTVTATCPGCPPLVWQCQAANIAPLPGYGIHTVAAAHIMRSQPSFNAGLALSLAMDYSLASSRTCLAAKFFDEPVPTAPERSSEATPHDPHPCPESGERGSFDAEPDRGVAEEGCLPDDEAGREEPDPEDDAVRPDNPFDTLKDIQDGEDLYELMELQPTATNGEIRKQFKRLAMQYHPDKNPGDEAAHAKFQQILRAYEILSDEERRALYDVYGISRPNVKIVFKPTKGAAPPPKRARRPRPPARKARSPCLHLTEDTGPIPAPRLICAAPVQSTVPEAAGDARPPASQPEPPPPPPLDQTPVLVLQAKPVRCRARFQLDKVIQGSVGNMNIAIQRVCGVCLGTATFLRGWTLAQCPKCLGVGKVARLMFTPDGAIQEVGVGACSSCHGDGYVLISDPSTACEACQGAGYRQFQVNVNLSIGPGMHDGQCLVLAGFVGSTTPLLLPGDAIIKLQIVAPEPWAIEGADLHSPLDVSLRTALAGGHVRVPILGKAEPLILPVPKALLSLLPETEVCLPYHGLPLPRAPGRRGHLILHCVVRFPGPLPGPVRRQLAALLPAGAFDVDAPPPPPPLLSPRDTAARRRPDDEKENIPRSILNVTPKYGSRAETSPFRKTSRVLEEEALDHLRRDPAPPGPVAFFTLPEVAPLRAASSPPSRPPAPRAAASEDC